ncbi:MAG: DMT family transporter [Candidatus Poribacteria bacterium]
MDNKKIGVISMIFADIMWAIEPIFAKFAYKNADILQTANIRALFVALTAIPYILITNRGNFKLSRKQLGVLVYIAIAGTLIADMLYLIALSKIPVINALIIGHLQPIFIIIIGFLMLKKERPAKSDYIGMLIMMASAVLVTTKTLGNFYSLRLGTFGDIIVVFATIAWATTAVAARKYLKDMNAGVMVFYRFIIAGIILTIYSLIKTSFQIVNIYQILIGIVVGIGTIFYYEGIKRLKAMQVSSLELATPFFGALSGFLTLGERITILQGAGILIMFVGVYLLAKKEPTS